jgi:glycosyltransferase involved in cell wall biosynthesis
MKNKRVVILYRYIPEYRLAVYERLYELCRVNSIDLDIIYGDPSKSDRLKNDSVDFEFGIFKRNQFWSFGKIELVWQPVLAQIRQADLVIVEQANKLVINYLLIARQILGRQRFAFWGHGRNFQATQFHSLSERMKRLMICRAHWWFAYTPSVARLVEAQGFPRERITTLYNAIDTSALLEFQRNISFAELDDVRNTTEVHTENICIYVGGMYSEKRISFLLEACIRVRRQIPDFQMIFIGSGTDAHLVKDFCQTHRWAIYLGSAFGRDKVKYFMLSKLLLMPGLVGLAVLDAFTLKVPIVTTNVDFHSPEFEYIENERNGIIVDPADDVDLYATTVVDLLTDTSRRAALVDGCRLAASKYTVENMVSHFFEGIARALAFPQSPI